MSRKTKIDLAIEQMEGEIKVLQSAIARLREQQPQKAPAPLQRPDPIVKA